MARYISEEEFIAWVREHWCSDCQNDNGLRCRACWIDDAIDIVEEAPTADVTPRVEVVREIFDEVLKTLFEMQKRYESIGHRGRVEQMLIARENILKLRRKYTDATDANVGHKTKENKKDAVTDVPIQLSIFDKEDNQ